MIRGIHGLFYSSKPEETRAFICDRLQLPFTDIHDGWLIFDFQEGDLGVHPTEGNDAMSGRHDISFFTDDVKGTVAELKARGVEFDQEVADAGYDLVTYFTMPGDVRVQLYQPHYQKRSMPKSKTAPKRAQKFKTRRASAKKKVGGRKHR